MEIKYNVVAGAEVKADVYSGENCDEHKPYIEAWTEGDEGTETMEELGFHSKRWPVGTVIKIEVPCCPAPDCLANAEMQDDKGKCTECGFDWKNWADEQYS
ncbi:hypothetical protein [Aliivibrio salmonicida]|uniref:hypothetical protein n=1 Tax=Aliivibrio salmonicida TaxID=40269 RepID=UPI003D122C3A